MVTAAAALVMSAAVAPAWAGTAHRAWVSGHGTDAAGCGAPTAPCRSFQYVHDNIVATGGEIDVLDPAGYGAITITKAISIVNDGVGTAGVQAISSPAITINAGPGDAVYLRGLELDGQSTSIDGILLNSAASLVVENCVIRHFASDGMLLQPTAGSVFARIADTAVLENGNQGILYDPFSGSAVADIVLDHVSVDQNGGGVAISAFHTSGSVQVAISNSDASHNASFGVAADGAASRNTVIEVSSTTMNQNQEGVHTFDFGVIHVARSIMDENSDFGILNGSSTPGGVFSSGDNHVEENATAPTSGTLLSDTVL